MVDTATGDGLPVGQRFLRFELAWLLEELCRAEIKKLWEGLEGQRDCASFVMGCWFGPEKFNNAKD